MCLSACPAIRDLDCSHSFPGLVISHLRLLSGPTLHRRLVSTHVPYLSGKASLATAAKLVRLIMAPVTPVTTPPPRSSSFHVLLSPLVRSDLSRSSLYFACAVITHQVLLVDRPGKLSPRSGDSHERSIPYFGMQEATCLSIAATYSQ